ncbi:MAG: Na-Ca exchanger/integrin-beta4, partial [Ilumatobacteraceae bacterium]|nr:Na-Ca exchanger/integrin-beta4 [Ilumatobacteraceae bacterium]
SFTVKLSTVSAKNVSATYKTRNGTGSTGAVGGPTSGDFVSVNSTTITIPAGSTQATIVITVRKDRTKEKNEQFFIDLSNLQNTVLGDGSAKGTITNDD